MRTTLAIDDDVLTAARALADQQHRSVGAVISALARQALPRPARAAERNGVPLLAARSAAPAVGTTRPWTSRVPLLAARSAAPVTLDLVNGLRDEAP